MMNHPPIPISELAEHTDLLKANDNLKLSQEYEVMHVIPFFVMNRIVTHFKSLYTYIKWVFLLNKCR